MKPSAAAFTRVRAGTALTLVALLTACGPIELTKPSSQGAPPPPAPDAIEQNWDDPILGTVVAGVTDASVHVAFKPLVPNDLGNPSKVFVQLSNPDKQRRVLAFVYDHGTYGRIVIKEWLPDPSAGDFAAFVSSIVANDDPSLPGHADAVTIRSGITALMTETEDRSLASLRWLEGGILLSVKGPKLKRDDVIAVANGL